MLVRLGFICFLVAGCGFHAVGHDDASVGDMAVSDEDLAGVPPGDDLYGVPPGSDLATTSAVCGWPQLLVGVENLHNGDSGGGRIARLAVTAAGTQPCGTLRGQGNIGAQPQAVAGFYSYVAAAALANGTSGVWVVDPATDVVKWSRTVSLASGWGPIAAFPIDSGNTASLIAVAYGIYGNPSTIRQVNLYDEIGTESSASPWCIQETGCTTNLPLSLEIVSMTIAPASPTHLLALDVANANAAVEVDGWAMPNPTKATYVGLYSGSWSSIAAVRAGTTTRVAWTDTANMGGVQWMNDTGGTPSVQGPVKCAAGCATILDSLPDPTTNDQFFVLCDGASVDTRSVWRLTTSGACTEVLDGAGFGAESRLSSLAIAQ